MGKKVAGKDREYKAEIEKRNHCQQHHLIKNGRKKSTIPNIWTDRAGADTKWRA